MVVLNDGSGTFDKLTQQRLPVRINGNTGADFALSGSFQMAEHDETKSPRMVPFNRGVAFAMETGLGYFSFTAVTDEHAAVAPIGAPLQSGQLVLDMKTARLNGQAGQYKDDLIFLTDDGNVHIVEHDLTAHAVAAAVPGGAGSAQRLGVGNVMGDAPRAYKRGAGAVKDGTLLGQVDNAGAVEAIAEVDPRSLDIVVATTTGVHVLPSAIYDPTAPTNGIASLKAATWRLAHTFATPTPREVTALQVRDLDGNSFADFVVGVRGCDGHARADAIYRSIVYTKAALLQGAVYERPTAASIEDPTKMTFTEKKLSPVADGGGSAQAANDAHSTSQLVVADMQRQGNLDIIYASDKNEPARVSYARPPADPTPVAAETSDLQMEADAYRARRARGHARLHRQRPRRHAARQPGHGADRPERRGRHAGPRSRRTPRRARRSTPNPTRRRSQTATRPQRDRRRRRRRDAPAVPGPRGQPRVRRGRRRRRGHVPRAGRGRRAVNFIAPDRFPRGAVRGPALPRLHPARPALRERPSAADARRRHGAHLRHRAAQGLSPCASCAPRRRRPRRRPRPRRPRPAARAAAEPAAAFAAAALAAAKSSPVAAAKSSPRRRRRLRPRRLLPRRPRRRRPRRRRPRLPLASSST